MASTIFTVSVALLFVFFIFWVWKIGNRSKKLGDAEALPLAGGSWPIIGHLHLLAGSKPGHLTLADMADKYGPVFTVKLGGHSALIVANWEVAKECLTTNDQAFASRPNTTAVELMSYNRALFGFAPYGPYWRQARKTATLELLSNHRLETLKPVRESEINASIRELYEQWRENTGEAYGKLSLDMRIWFQDLTLNVIVRILVGKRMSRCGVQEESVETYKKALRDFVELSGKFVLSDAQPYLRWLDIGGDKKRMKNTHKKLDQVMEKWLQEHKRKRANGELKGDEDFMGVMLSILEGTDDYDADTMNKAMCLALILAATDTTMVTMTWALSLLLNNREALDKVQQELDLQVGRHRPLRESDTKNLLYLQAVIKETLRLYPAAPLSLPHEAISDCVVAGQRIPAGTRLLVHLYKIHRDPTVWIDPLEFRPDRFLTTHKDFDVRGQNFEFMPFGSGRRMCPGISFALQVMSLGLSSVLQAFDFGTPLDEPVDMTEGLGLAVPKATPLQVLLSPRLPDDCYEPRV